MCVSEKICTKLYSDKNEGFEMHKRRRSMAINNSAKVRCTGSRNFGKGGDELTYRHGGLLDEEM